MIQWEEKCHELEGGYSYDTSSYVKQEIALWGSRVDDFFSIQSNPKIECYDKTERKNKKYYLNILQKNPQLTLTISPMEQKKDGVFHGIRVDAEVDTCLKGRNESYYVNTQNIYHLEKDYAEVMCPIFEYAQNGWIRFYVGRHELQAFYYNVLPKLQEYADIEIKDNEQVEKYLLPEVTMRFYLDAEDQDVSCKVKAVYGEKEVDCLQDVFARRLTKIRPKFF